MDYLLDTNFVINYFKGIYEGNARTFTDSIINETTFVSVITRIELLGWQFLSHEDQLLINDFISDSIVFSLEEPIIQQTIALRKTHKLKLPDAIIAATAVTHNLQLLTHNTKDFENIDGLTIIDAGSL